MTDYKLVPVEPTPEMVSAAEDAYMPFGDMDLALRMAILAAPAVQGEPVYWLVRTPEGRVILNKEFPGWADGGDGYKITPLYTAPQPAPDVAGLLTLLEHAQCNTCDGSGALYDGHGQVRQCQWCHERSEALLFAAEQQPSPDVAGLVEALDDIANLPIDPCSTKNDYRLSAAKAIANAELAAYRKGGEA